jgi:WD40 repeat protein
VWDVASGAQLRTLTGHTYPVTAVVVPPDKRRVISGSADKTIKKNIQALRINKDPTAVNWE